MSQVINLNKFRKRKAKAEREARAETNRRLHGRTQAERARDDLAKKQLTAKVEGCRLDKSDDDDSE
jgi:hypothetical protein